MCVSFALDRGTEVQQKIAQAATPYCAQLRSCSHDNRHPRIQFTVRSDSPVQCPHFSLTAALLSFFSSDLCRWPDLDRGRAPLTDHIQGQGNGGKATDQCQSHSRRFALVIV